MSSSSKQSAGADNGNIFCRCNDASKVFMGLRLLLFCIKTENLENLINTESTVERHNNLCNSLQKMFRPNNSRLWSLHRQLNIEVVLIL